MQVSYSVKKNRPVYGYYKSTGFDVNSSTITWESYSDGASNNYSNGITLSDNKVLLIPNYNGLYEIIVSGVYISSEGCISGHS